MRPREQQEDEMAEPSNLESFAIQFTKLVQVLELVDIQKEINVDVWGAMPESG